MQVKTQKPTNKGEQKKMKKEITFNDYVKVVILRNSINNLTKQLYEKQKDITELFYYFQQTKYHKTNFFIKNTIGNKLLNHLDYLDMNYSELCLKALEPIYKIIGGLDYYLVELMAKYENKKGLKNENN